MTDKGVWACRQKLRNFTTGAPTKPGLDNQNPIVDNCGAVKHLPELVITDLTDLKKLVPYQKLLNRMQGVYAFKNTVNGKQYIGSTQDLYKRLREHLAGRKSNLALQRAFSKYGKGAFHFYVYTFYKPLNGPAVSNLITLEDSFISCFPFDMLYNLKPLASSTLGYKHTEEAIAKMVARLANKENHPFFGKKHTEESKVLFSKPGHLNPMFGRKHTESTKLVLSAQKSKNPVGLYDVDHKLIKVFSNNVQVAQYLSINKTTVGRYIKTGKLFQGKYLIRRVL